MIDKIAEIKRLKKAKNAIILAHYYQNPEVQDIADYVGDSYQLSKIAKNTNASIIIFCGVHFMAETAKILSPEKEVYLPVKTAGCYMANTISGADLVKFKKEHPDYKIIGYVNTSAEVKALCDVCVTSSNALKVLNAYKGQKVLYLPDQNLARYANYLDKDLQVEYWNGCCRIHHLLTIDNINELKKQYPHALVLVHPEAPLEVLTKADYVGSTKDMIDFVGKSDNTEFIIGTEKGILHPLMVNYPWKKFYLLSSNLVCKTMKLTTINDIYDVLIENKNGRYEKIELDEEIIKKAGNALNEMLKY